LNNAYALAGVHYILIDLKRITTLVHRVEYTKKQNKIQRIKSRSKTGCRAAGFENPRAGYIYFFSLEMGAFCGLR
jgi:hypothetical protein